MGERELNITIAQWRQDLISAADLQTTDLVATRKVYKHFQYEGDPSDDDDHYSPVNPEDYMQLRIDKVMRFYLRRLPFYTKKRFLLRMFLLLVSTASIVMSYMGEPGIVTMTTALASAAVTWDEYTDTTRKIE